MFAFIRDHQLNIMMCLVAVCTIIAISIGISNNMSKKRRILMIAMAIAVASLLECDRAAYMYRGVISNAAYLWVRVANFSVFALSIGVQYLFNEFLIDLITHEGGFASAPKRLIFNRYLSALGILLLIFSQFTGWYYTFDENNRYQRGPGFVVCYIVPMVIFLILLTADAKYTKEIHRNLRVALFLFVVLPLSASIVQVFTYGLSLTNMSLAVVIIIIYIFALTDANETIETANKIKIGHLKEDQESLYRLFEQTATAFVSAIDAKDKYTKGHSVRVGKYAKTLAEMAGKTKEECRNIYYAALLHEIGKIAIPDSILSKDKSLTDEEYAVLKQYPTIGRDILSSITEFPFLAEGAMYHHEKYDGTGYPEGLSGEDIPELARIIAVADAYDTMTSQRSYRDPIPQQKVREEFVKGMGTQFDPEYTKLMIHMIDLDSEYEMQEKVEVTEFNEKTEIDCGDYRDSISEGTVITGNPVSIKFRCTPKKKHAEDITMPALVLFDSLDGRVHTTLREIDNLNYFEYAEMWFDGHAISSGARNLKSIVNEIEGKESEKDVFDRGDSIEFELQACKYKDHVMLRLLCEYETMEVIVALPDNSRFAYVGFTGEHCYIDNVRIEHSEAEVDENTIPRIADEVSYINRMQGDLPNIQIDGYRTDATKGVEVTDGMEIYFHAMSLPTARLVWHCPFINIYYSDDMIPMGEGYKEYALIRFDGEAWEEGEYSTNRISMKKEPAFKGWDEWKNFGKKGFDTVVTFRRKGNKITTITENNGISIKNVTHIKAETEHIYVSLTGDQVALTDIRVKS